MKRNFIAKRFQSAGTGLTLDTAALAKYKDIVDLSIGDTDFTTDEAIINAAFRDAKAGYTHYGDPKGDPELISAVCKAWEEDFDQSLPRDHVLVSASSCLGMSLAMFAILDPGDEVIVFSPYFALYRAQIELAGGVCVDVPTYAEEDYAISEERLRAAITPRTKAIIFNNPTNPTGMGYDLSTMEMLARVAKEYDLLIAAVERALKDKTFLGRVYLVAAGKAAWQMAHAARACLQDNFCGGVVVTKYGHVNGEIADVACFEGGHPVPDENSLRGTDAALALTEDLTESDTVVFLLSGGGSALFEKPLLPLAELQDVTNQLLAAGADIVEINTIRKRLSAVKGGRFARHCAPAQVFAVVLSDILGDPLDMIASGPAYPDSSSCAQALDIAKRYGLRLSERAWALLAQETPKTLTNVETQITGSVRELCAAAAAACEALGYEPMILTDCLCCEAREAGSMLASIARTHARDGKNLAFLMGGETVVHLRGKGLGGRNQEIALSAALGIEGLSNALVFSVGSDGTDGPTDAAGGIADGETAQLMRQKGVDAVQSLNDNDAYHALGAVGGLLKTGATGTNVNDVTVLLLRTAE